MRGSLSQLRHPLPNSMAKKNISNPSTTLSNLLLPWMTFIDLGRGKSCPSRAAMANREAAAPRTLQWGRGAVEKI
jgi:hypothetical protein